ncbi:FAD-binding oxidoreductase [Stieleria sp. TO1_6]|uniref:FAD-binding oxidoreductase n=1 Tax=Stieleria tagensis TaxID=2956795 RepID=UPI00209A8122|nr:FAD-binding oxidoreductase [Stieleria tagensis]MCO8122513.1 FAD-binding oxidoreductase [Stieleria tagensis]
MANPTDTSLSLAITSWTNLLGQARVITDATDLIRHAANTIGSRIQIPVVLRPGKRSDVQQIVKIAAEHRAPIYPTSTGRNWGYGSATPAQEGCAVLDMSELTQIRIIDRELGLVELEPGVTQGMLADHLTSEGLDWMVPVHGGGPDCSLLGNALERGYGLTPTTDHFAALTSLEAILADGSIYRSPLMEMGAELVGAAHRWQIGPYIEGLFSQGNFGVVTRATFTLQRRPEHVEAFFIRIGNETQFGEMVESLRDLLSSLGACLAGVNLMNDRRVLSMSHPYPVDQVHPGEVMSDSLCNRLTRGAGITPWTAAGVIHCPRSMRRVIRKELRRHLPASFPRPIHMNNQRTRAARSLANRLPSNSLGFLRQLDSIEALLDLANGFPRRVALPLAYWLRGESPNQAQPLNPAKDGCGLIWYSPLVPMKSEIVQAYTQVVTRTCRRYGIEPLITLTTLSERLFDSTVPILFRPNEDGAPERAKDCFNALNQAGKSLGCTPYRYASDDSLGMVPLGRYATSRTSAKLRKAIDPHSIIAPGRYSSPN